VGEIEKNNRRLPWRRGDRKERVYRPGPFALIYAGLLAAGLVAAAAVYVVLVHDVPGMRANRADTLKTALLVIGGSGALAGLYVAYRKQRTDEANHLRDQDKLFTERYTAAVAQLGNTAAAVRLGGVYALARIADDSERDRPTCLKVLCAYLRMPYDPDDPAIEPAERQVRTTAQTAIAERLRPDHPGYWPDARIDLTGSHLIGLDFSGVSVGEFTADRARFGGDAVFSGATFNENASFRGATFSRDAGFDEATFNATGGFVGATFSRDAGFRRATFNRYAGFSGAMFNGNAGFGGAAFNGNTRFDGATFNGDAGFNGLTFKGDAGFDGVTFNGNSWFRGATFNMYAGFREATFNENAWFREATFDRVAEFSKTTFNMDAGFGEASFSGDAVFAEATFNENASFREATFDQLVGFSEARFCRDHPPVWPDGFAEPAGLVWADPPAASPDPGPASWPDPDTRAKTADPLVEP